MKAFTVVEVYLHSFLTLAGELSASRPSRFNPEQIVPGAQGVSGRFVEETNPLLLLGIEPRFSDVQRHRLNCTIKAPNVTLIA